MKDVPTLTNLRPEFKALPTQLNEHLLNLGEPHVNSFDEMLKYGLANSAKYMLPEILTTPAGETITLQVEDITIARPKVPLEVLEVKERNVFPVEIRQLRQSYTGMCTLRVGWKLNGLLKETINVDVGEVPVMLKSKACNLHNLTPAEMVARGEHDSEWGGVFIVKGNEKIIRMLMMTRRNYPISVKRSTWKMRGAQFSELGVMIRTVREDEESQNNVLHYLNNGTAKLMFSYNKSLSYVPVCLILKCLVPYSDEEIFKHLIQGLEKDQYYISCIQHMLRELHAEGLHTQNDCKEYMDKLFRPRFPEFAQDNLVVINFILDNLILIHLNDNKDKFNLLVFMVQKLFQTADGTYKIENVDSVMMQELLLPGHLYQKVLCEKIAVYLHFVRRYLEKKLNVADMHVSSILISQALRSSSISRGMESFLATGNIVSKSGMGLMQNSGLVIMAENINRMRYMSHFRAVHRGSYFTTMRTTEARQLLPDAWGFICPVHTPDGTPCGLLNHLTVTCKISDYPKKELVDAIPGVLIDMGMIPVDSSLRHSTLKFFVVFLEGKLLGYIRQTYADKIVDRLRFLKINGELPTMMEIAYIPYKKKGQCPGLYLFVGAARMMRPVINLMFKKVEYIGSLEQVYLDIAIQKEEAYAGFTTHMELSKTAFLSNLANLIPMPDYNQSPRNMYQCQMGKQTMGTPCLNWPKLAANKLYRLQTPATPLFRPTHYDNIKLDDFAMGTNAIVAVISYTGYDMEDAMIINKSAHERGFAYGSIYKSKFIELEGNSYFARSPYMPELVAHLDNDGLPHSGAQLKYGSPFYCYYDTDESKYKVVKVDEKEDCTVDSIRYCGNYKSNSARMVCITIRVPRPASIGDKFASRAGQKGICSQHYPAEDLPFTETGLIPDIVFNPHGFPSRMTIAMMIETMAGKSAALHGLVHDATPFRFSEQHTAIDYFGKLLEAGGYNYYGTERLYSGVDGHEMTADIFFGVVHYQRLRHMVSDKWQVRSTGPVDAITQQPIKGRKRGGGVRFGEMERDALISHGAAFLLQDRLFHNSDKMYTLVCSKCGSILAPRNKKITRSAGTGRLEAEPTTCLLCGDGAAVSYIEIPYSFKYLATELSAVNINARFKLQHI